VLDAVVFNFMNNDERWVAVVGLYEGRPYEIFTGRAVDSFSVLTKITKGKVLKIKENSKNRYDFQYEDKDGYKVTIEGLSRTFDKEYWNYARLISGVLRHGCLCPMSWIWWTICTSKVLRSTTGKMAWCVPCASLFPMAPSLPTILARYAKLTGSFIRKDACIAKIAAIRSAIERCIPAGGKFRPRG